MELVNTNNAMANFVKTDDILQDMRGIIDSSREKAYQAVNIALLQRNWLIGYRIAEEELKGENRAEYGASVIKQLSKELSAEYGKGFDYSTLYKFVRFYKCFPTILDSASPKSEIFHSASEKSAPLLSWTHYSRRDRSAKGDVLFAKERRKLRSITAESNR